MLTSSRSRGTQINRQVTLAARPAGFPKVSDFHLVYTPLPAPAVGEALVRSVYLSLDPGTRGRMGDAYPYLEPLAIGDVITGGAVGFVVESADPTMRAGDVVAGMLGWQEYAIAKGCDLRRIDPGRAPISTALGVLGASGLAAFFGMLGICDPQPGETAVVSGAAGGVGMLAAQIAKIRGCRVVGVVGSDAKVSWLLDELGIDAAFNYKSELDLPRRLERLCPDGVDVYFDNVGGAITDAVVGRISSGARIAVCGELSQYHLDRPQPGPRWLGQLIVKQATVQGFLISGYTERFGAAFEQLAAWIGQGRLKYREAVAHGIASAPQAFIAMLQGKHLGQQLVQLSE